MGLAVISKLSKRGTFAFQHVVNVVVDFEFFFKCLNVGIHLVQYVEVRTVKFSFFVFFRKLHNELYYS